MEAVEIMDGIIHRDAHADGHDGDRHHVEGDVHDAHDPKDGHGGKEVRENGHQSDLPGTKKDKEHGGQGQNRVADGLDLRVKEAAQHVVV